MTDYEKQANDFLKKTGAKITVKYDRWGTFFPDDKESRAIFRFTIRNGKNSYSARFGQSIAAGMEPPTNYDILACMTKNDPGTFEDFCSDYGYDQDSRKAEKLYKAVCREFAGIQRLFSDSELEEMAEIQ